jgi:hypothetical protein
MYCNLTCSVVADGQVKGSVFTLPERCSVLHHVASCCSLLCYVSCESVSKGLKCKNGNELRACCRQRGLQKRHKQATAVNQPRLLPGPPSLFFFNCSKLSSKSNSHQCDDTQLLKICLRIRIGLELSPGCSHSPAMMIACSCFHPSHHP